MLLAAAVVAGVLALRESDNARDSARTADAQRLGAQALIDDRLERSLLLAQAGRELDDSVATRGYLLSALVRRPAAIGVMQGAFSGVAAMALSPDGRILAAGGFNGTVLLLDTRTRTRIGRPLRFPHDLGSIDFSPDGRMLAISGSVSEADPRRVKLVDVATRKVVRTIDAGPYPEDREVRPFVEVRFVPDGRAVVVIVQAENSQAGTFPPYVRRYDVRTGRPLGSAVRIGRRPAGLALTVESRRDRLLFTGPDETLVIDTATLRVRRRVPAGAWTNGLSPDGRYAALGYEDGRVAVLDLRSGRAPNARGPPRGSRSGRGVHRRRPHPREQGRRRPDPDLGPAVGHGARNADRPRRPDHPPAGQRRRAHAVHRRRRQPDHPLGHRRRPAPRAPVPGLALPWGRKDRLPAPAGDQRIRPDRRGGYARGGIRLHDARTLGACATCRGCRPGPCSRSSFSPAGARSR